MTTVFVPKEVHAGETRVAATPETVKRMIKRGIKVTVERGAGVASDIIDAAFEQAGATLVDGSADDWSGADLVLKVLPPEQHPTLDKHEVELLKEGAFLISFVFSVTDPELAQKLQQQGVSAIAMEAVPRISRAQKMDALSSQANLAGYKAVLLGANAMGKIMPMMVTAAGTLKPAKTVIMGAGVAGLQAIATAKRLGAVVWATDIRPAVKEQVESLGGKFIDVPGVGGGEDAGGYAKALTPEQLKEQQKLVREHLVDSDLVVTTALVPGRKAPTLIPADVVKDMKPGAVIVDLAVAQGGNCELSEPGKTVEVNGVKILGEVNMPGLLAADASAVYARNVLALVTDMTDKESGEIKLNLEDEVYDKALITHEKAVRHGPTQEAIEKLTASAS
ncbi:MAG: Re/Si-specific NAD(P)(+) transhydrogenase subunit alpha [Planctomycetes bacterium]|nr:Re/Si-specific NAD(P)(+) transhydrogenase subunit alpha [Planctomycetota bacterium]